jgi:hypothetical protein
MLFQSLRKNFIRTQLFLIILKTKGLENTINRNKF